jgi:hypothetical protein
MNVSGYSRRDFSVRLSAMLPVFGMAERAFGLPDTKADRNGISHTCEISEIASKSDSLPDPGRRFCGVPE